jgi:hypothetical protein
MPLKVGNILGFTDEGTGRAAATPASCSCPACAALECLDRPRFFAGQLLSEAELNGEMDYILAKQRLHNRHLHGPGVVCGLEVVCSECEGQVIIRPGYAIDPCGNDVVVCQDQPFDVLKAIKACCAAMKKKSKSGCDPYAPANAGCTGLEEHWCITLSYLETMAQPVTPLRGKKKTCSCGGSCGGNCGCNGSSAAASPSASSNGCSGPSAATATTTATATACEPTRIREGYQIGITPDPGNCKSPATLFGDTLFANIIECLGPIFDAQTTLPSSTWGIVLLALTHQLANSDVDDNVAFQACCQFRQFVINLFTNSDFATRCTLLSVFDSLPCPQPPSTSVTGVAAETGSDAAYLQQVQDTIDSTVVLLLEYLRECVCHALQPPCPPEARDDRLILACVTVKDGKITEICNFGCRQFAGSFPSFFYWLSLIPIVPLIKLLVTDICCGPALALPQSRISNNRERLDPAGALKNAVVDGNFALPRMVLQRIGDLAQKFSLKGIVASIPADGLNLATLRGMSVQNAQASLKEFGVSFEERPIGARTDIPLAPAGAKSFAAPFARSGDHVILYESGGQVQEVLRAGTAQASAEDVSALRRQVESLQADIADLKKKAPPSGPK